jgi:hypothetical protein
MKCWTKGGGQQWLHDDEQQEHFLQMSRVLVGRQQWQQQPGQQHSQQGQLQSLLVADKK